MLQNEEVPTEKKWPIFKHFWARAEHTAYAREVKYVMQSYGEKDMTLESLKRFSQSVERITGDKYIEFLNSLNIKAVLVNIFRTAKELKCFLEGEIKLPDCFKLLIPLPVFHASVRSFQGIQEVAGIIDKAVTSLDEFLNLVKEFLGV